MNTFGYWLLRLENQLFAIDQSRLNGIFPPGTATDMGCPGAPLLIGEWQGHPCYAADIDTLPECVADEPIALRSLYELAGEEAFLLAGRASQLLDWQRNHRFCGRCGTPTTKQEGEFAMGCPSCGLLAYPRISPAIMVLIQRGDEFLLARSRHFRPGMFSAIAGFVEAGETLEECVAREVREEVGVRICNLRYFKSQPWPFPDSLMVAFFADYAGGELAPDPGEIEAAGWFKRDALPPLPDRVSLARRLIEAACRSAKPESEN